MFDVIRSSESVFLYLLLMSVQLFIHTGICLISKEERARGSKKRNQKEKKLQAQQHVYTRRGLLLKKNYSTDHVFFSAGGCKLYFA